MTRNTMAMGPTDRAWRRTMFGVALMCAFALFAAAVPAAARAADMPEFQVLMQDHAFKPDTLKVPADTRFKLRVTNKNAMPTEFESAEFNREKIVLPGTTVTIYVGPLKPGTYRFFDDFHQETKGTLVVE